MKKGGCTVATQSIETATSGVMPEDGVWRGPFRQPVNGAANVPNSIHNDEVARKLGLAGGPVTGIVLNDQYPPVLLRAFGRRWLEQGSLSNYYRVPVLDREDVRVCVQDPAAGVADMHVESWMEDRQGVRRVLGSAAVGAPNGRTALRERFEHRPPSGELRMLKDVPIGATTPERIARVSAEQQRARRESMTDPLDWYWDESPWGGPICTPLGVFSLMIDRPRLIALVPDNETRAYGAIETNVIDGPIFTDRDYVSTSRFLAVGQTPKTEYLWFESTLRDPERDRVVATMLMMYRWMKGTSPAYA
jgi:hypothetical protein